MSRERTIVVPRCLRTTCPRDADPGCGGYCNADYQGVCRRIRQGKYTKEELIARGKLLRSRSELDEFLESK